MTDTLFNEVENEVIDEDTPNEEDTSKIEELVKDPVLLAKRKLDSDRFIKQLQNELKGLREDLKTRTTLEEFLTKMNSPVNPNPVEPNTPEHTPSEGTVDKETLERLLEQKLQERETKTRQEGNLAFVANKLRELYGNDYVNILEQRRRELDVDKDFLDNLARSNPKVFLATIGANAPQEARPQGEGPSLFPKPVASNERRVSNPNAGVRNNRYFAEILKKDPNKYWSPEIQNEMYRLAAEQGDKFYE